LFFASVLFHFDLSQGVQEMQEEATTINRGQIPQLFAFVGTYVVVCYPFRPDDAWEEFKRRLLLPVRESARVVSSKLIV